MILQRFGIAVRLVCACLLLSAAAGAQSWNWSIVPGIPVANHELDVSIVTSPCPNPTVELWIDGRRSGSVAPGSPGIASFFIPAAHAGKKWEVRVICPGSTESASGAF